MEQLLPEVWKRICSFMDLSSDDIHAMLLVSEQCKVMWVLAYSDKYMHTSQSILTLALNPNARPRIRIYASLKIFIKAKTVRALDTIEAREQR
jgi:hypothetical protein